MPPTDAELMQRFGAGDDEAFRELVERHHKGLLNYFWRRCFDRQMAEDCVQEVFLRLVRHRGRWKPTAKFTTYMYRIAENYWIDKYRSKKAAPPQVSMDSSGVGDGGESRGELGSVLPSRGRAPEERASNVELAGRIQAAVERLSDQQQSVFVMAETRGMRYADIAEALDIPVGTVKSRMHAAVRRLRELLSEDANDHLR